MYHEGVHDEQRGERYGVEEDDDDQPAESNVGGPLAKRRRARRHHQAVTITLELNTIIAFTYCIAGLGLWML